jgi:hypothetical protein
MRIVMKVTPLKKQDDFWSVTPGKEYVVIGLDHDSYRIVDDMGEPILLPKDGFEIIDNTIPGDWIWERYSEDEYYADPPELHARGFYEDYFDGKHEARKQFVEAMKKYGIEVKEMSPEDKANMLRSYWEQSSGDK